MHDRPLEDVDFIQAGVLFDRVMNDSEKANTVSNIAGHLGKELRLLNSLTTSILYLVLNSQFIQLAVPLSYSACKKAGGTFYL